MCTRCWPKNTFFAQNPPHDDGKRTIIDESLYRQRIMVL